MVQRLVGARVRRAEDPRLLTGAGRFMSDVTLPGMLHAAFVRSTVAHALIVGIDVEPAIAAPGVVAVFTGADLRARQAMPMNVSGAPGFRPVDVDLLAVEKVRFVGDPIAIVLATSRALAEDAAEAVTVDLDPLPAVTSATDAIAPGAPAIFDGVEDNVIFEEHLRYGDADAAFDAADRVVRASMRQHRVAHVPMECRGGVATFDARRGELTYHAAHQAPHMMRMAIAGICGLPANRVRIVCGDIGGSFGQKGALGREDVVLALVSIALARPCKWVEDRMENLQAAGQAREESLELEAAVTNDGRILGLRGRLLLDQGAYPGFGVPSSMFVMLVRLLLPGPYSIAHYDFDATAAVTNKASYLAYRGPWEMETFSRERLLDLIADDLGISTLDVRRANLLTAGDQPTALVTGPDLEGVTARETFERAIEAGGYDEFRARQADALVNGRYLGIGFSTYLEPAPGPPNWGDYIGFKAPPERAHVRVEPDGTVTVATSQNPHGQGHETTLAQLVADELGVPFERVRVVFGDTSVTPFSTFGTGGSRAATVASGAVIGASGLVRDQICAVAAQMLEANVDDIVIEDGMVGVRGVPARNMPLAQLAMMSYMAPDAVVPAGQAPGFEATFDYVSGRGGWVNATHCAQVEVDIATGLVTILRFLVVEDCGEIINPGIVAGQIRGGVAQGIGEVLLEHSAYDDDGNNLASTFMDYLIPTSMDIPDIEIVHLESPPVDAVNFRGVGEGGAVGAPAALVNAIADALRPVGARITESYLPPSRVLELAGVLNTKVDPSQGVPR
jgi:carbon-monoxide dehydrogenase large subunit